MPPQKPQVCLNRLLEFLSCSKHLPVSRARNTTPAAVILLGEEPPETAVVDSFI